MSETMKVYGDVAKAGLHDWRMLAQAIHARFATTDYASGLRLVQRIGEAAEAANHHPDVTLSYGRVDVSLVSHDVDHVTQRDLDLAERISEAAQELGCVADTVSLSQVEVALDSPRPESVRAFWAAALGYDPLDGAPDELRDPFGHGPNVWLQDSGDELGRQRWHYDVFVPAEQVQARIDAALAAGGTLVEEHPDDRFWVLADAEGNRMCVCTAAGRGE